MFGYIVVNQPELKMKEYDEYRKYYCGLCKSLKDRYGARGQISLSYDMTFLYLLFRAPADLNERLRPLGTQVRSCANYPGLGPEWYRTAVRTAPENARLLELMKEVLG